MRVLIVTETFLPKMDGIVRVILRLLDHLTERGIETMVLTAQLGDEPLSTYKQSRVFTINGPRYPWYPDVKFTPLNRAAYRAVADFQPDVAHLFHPVALGIPSIFMLERMNVPQLLSFHLDYSLLAQHLYWGPLSLGFLKPITDVLTRHFFNRVDYRLAPSRAIQQKMAHLGIRDVGIWKRGVDAERFHPRFANPAMRQRLSAGHPDDLLLLYVGRLSREKRLQDLQGVLQQIPASRLALVGDGPYRAALERIFAGTNTVFTGRLSGADLSAAYASSDIFIFPSELETFGLVVVEAMAAGLPVVASRVGGVPDVITEGENGYSFAVGDVDAMIAGVQRIAATPQTLQKMATAARDYAAQQTWPAMMDEVITHYERLVASAT